jgi:ribosomal protein S18 acetylase RimI-like enzyme
MTHPEKQGLVAKRSLANDEIAEIADLAAACDAHDHATIRVNWSSLAARSGDEANDFLYYKDGALVGALSLYVFGSDVAEASGMVHPSERRRGIFRALVEATAAELKRRGIPKLLFFCDHASASGIAALKAFGAQFDHAEHKMVLDQARMPETFDERLRVERAGAEDAADFARIVAQAFGGMDDEDLREQIARRTDSETYHYYLARLDETPIGALTVIFNGREAGIFGFGVLQEYRGRGYGRQILARAIAYTMAAEPEKIILEVEPENDRALGLYVSVGFRETHRYDYYGIDIKL